MTSLLSALKYNSLWTGLGEMNMIDSKRSLKTKD